MSSKDKINKISGIISLSMLVLILSGLIFGNDSLFGFPNAMVLYILMPTALIWFGTRKNGCGSCNQAYSVSESKKDKSIKSKI
jgi:hypothetical protein